MRSRGFTLMELVAVIALITVLAAFLLPVLAQARDRAWQTVCLSNVRQIARAQFFYLQDWDEQFPHWWQLGPPRPPQVGLFHFWTQEFRPYLHTEAIFYDPTAQEPGPRDGERLADYALVTWGPGGRGTPEDPHWRWPGPPLTLAQVVRPAETLILMDGYTTTGSTTGWVFRHGGGMNVAFVDGHGRWLPAGGCWRADTDGKGFYWLHYATADR